LSIHDLFSLQGKTALVTGCKRGIGKAIAIALAEAGADIIGVSSTLESSGSSVENEVVQRGRKFHAFSCDFSKRNDLYNFISDIKAKFDRIDILVNNAGTILREPALSHPDDYWDRVMDINLDSQFILSREIGKMMVKQGSGKIIFIASLLSFQGGINVPSYAASKGAITQLVKALSNEWAQYDIQVNAIAPGYIATDNTSALREDSDRSQAILSRIPANRWGQPDDFTGVSIFLASKASDYMTGSVVTVDGGWMGR
jgi:2-dehydro-3-deoxy-D-gluconate 5-dehydrogenase